MSKRKDQQDLAIRLAISGHDDDDLSKVGVSIEPDYFARERRENFRASLVWVKPVIVKRTEMELAIWKQDRQMSELERKRTNKPELEYPRDENDVGIIRPPKMHVEIV